MTDSRRWLRQSRSLLPQIRGASRLRRHPPSRLQAKKSKPKTAAASTTTYTVRRGDNLSKIAKRFGTTVAAIQKANGMSGTRLDIGDKLKIPARRR